MANLKHMNNDMAVSPIVATLVLIVVAVIGAVAVGTIMGTFSTDVSKQANAGNAAGASQTEIVVAGSTTVDPVTQAAAKLYTKENAGVKISSQATGSGAGFQAVTMGVADIGAMSEDMSVAQKSQNTNAIAHRIGSGAVVAIVNAATPAANYIPGDLNVTFTGVQTNGVGAAIGTLIPVYRSDSSGTADTFFKFTSGYALAKAPSAYVTGAIGKSGNAALVQYVGATKGTIGFTDYGYAAGRSDVRIQGIDDGIKSYTSFAYDDMKSAAQKQYRTYVLGSETTAQSAAKYNYTLIHPLYYITNGNPTTLQGDYIKFAQSGAAVPAFEQTNTFALASIF